MVRMDKLTQIQKDRRRAYERRYYEKNKVRLRAIAREYHRKKRPVLRRKALTKLGGKCVVCGFADPRALCIDHKDDGGTQERKKMNGYSFYIMLLRMSDGEAKAKYQVLCANHNMIKKLENDETGRKYPIPVVSGSTGRERGAELYG